MEDFQKMLHDFIMERTQDGKQEEMAAAIEEMFKPPQDGEFNPEIFRKGIEVITTMLRPEAIPEFQRRMNPFAEDENAEPPEIRNMLVQPNKLKWRDNTPKSTPDEMRAAFECSKKAHDMKCDCWNTRCTFYGDCRKCIVFHLCLKQFPTCHRSYLGDLEEHYIVFSRDGDK